MEIDAVPCVKQQEVRGQPKVEGVVRERKPEGQFAIPVAARLFAFLVVVHEELDGGHVPSFQFVDVPCDGGIVLFPFPGRFPDQPPFRLGQHFFEPLARKPVNRVE